MQLSTQRCIWSIFILTLIFLLLSWQQVYAGKWVKATNSKCWIWNPNPIPNEAVTYTGDCFSGLADGMGVCTWYQNGKKKSTDSGQFKDGRLYGRGIITGFNERGKKTYTASGQFVEYKRNGAFKETFFKDDLNYITVKRKFSNNKVVGSIAVTAFQKGKKKRTRIVSEKEFNDIMQQFFKSAEKKAENGQDNRNSDSANQHLTRDEAKHVFLDSGWNVIVVSVNKQNTDAGKLYNFLTEQGFIKAKQVLFTTEVKPTKKLLPYNMSGEDIGTALFGMVSDRLKFWYGDIKEVNITGISLLSKYQAVVELNATLKLTEIGKILDNANHVAIVLKYQYYDDGWRIKDILWDETEQKNRNKHVKIHGFYPTPNATDVVLNNMHLLGEYSDNYLELAGVLKQADYYPFLKTAAWAYHDNGYRSEAVNLFRQRIIPAVMKKGTKLEVEEYKEDFKKIQSIKEEQNEYNNIVLFATDEFRVLSCSFYENRMYKRSFAKSNARYIGVEVKFQNLQFAKRNHTHTIKRIYYYPNDTIMASPDDELLTIKKRQSWAIFSQGWGWKDLGHWQKGTYHVEVFVDGVKIARKAFSIDDIEDSFGNKEYLKNTNSAKGVFEYNRQKIYYYKGRELTSKVLDSARPVLVTGICPFECCTLGPWTATSEVTVYDRPGGGDPMRMLVQGEPVFAIESLIKTFPLTAIVNRVHQSDIDQGLNIGTIINVLCPLGEGYMAVYYKGKLISKYFGDFRYDQKKNFNQKQWTWWAKVILENGDKGWIKNPRLFKGMDSCSSN